MSKISPYLFLRCSIVILFTYIPLLYGQNSTYNLNKISKPLLKSYSNKIYNGSASNWSVIQDKRGVMYFGNENGVLEYDGYSWRTIKIPNTDGVRTLALDKDGIVYASAYAEFGYLQPDSIGQLQYKSLLPYLKKNEKNFGEMWDVAVSSEGVFFKSKDKVFRIVENKVTIWDSVFAFRLYNVNDIIYSRNQDVGLMMVDGDDIKLMPDGDFFEDIGVYDMLPFKANGNNKILVTTNRDGLFQHDGKKFSPFQTEADSYLKENQIYNACETSNGNFAFATQRGGVVIINKNGELVRIINEKSGLPTNVVYDVYSIEQGGLWLATANGITYCEEPSPFSIIENSGMLKEKTNDVIRFKNNIYVANELGILYLFEEKSQFKLTDGSTKPAYSFFDAGNMLIASTNWGTIVVDGSKLKTEVTERMANNFISSKKYPDRIYSADNGGFTVYQKVGNNLKVIYEKEIGDFSDIAEDDDGTLWLVDYTNNLIKVIGNLKEFSSENENNIMYETFYNNNKLPGKITNIINIENKLLLTTEKGIFTINKKTNELIPDSTLGIILSDTTSSIFLIEKSFEKSLWILAEINDAMQLGKAVYQNNGKYKWKNYPEFQRLDLDIVSNLYSDYYPQTNTEKLWLNTNDGLFIYNSSLKNNFNLSYSTIVRKVIANHDSVIYGGKTIRDKNYQPVILPYSKNDIIFEYSSTSFDKPEETLYQHYLEGDDESWSNWTPEIKKEYTNLSQGDYNFKVRAKNIYGIIGSEDHFAFKIMPPWYFTWWAYLLYGLVFAFGIFIVDRIQRRRLVKKERDRAKLREAELIRKQAEELETVDRLVRVINKADNLEILLNSLLNETVKFIPQAEKAAIFLFDHNDNKYRVASTLGYQITNLENISFSPEELKKRYTEYSEEVEKGIYILSNRENLFENKLGSEYRNIKSLLVMAVEKENVIEAYVTFDSFADKNLFDPSTASILNKFREHAVSAISKVQTLKTLQEKNKEIVKTHEQLIIQEKLASLGTLTAGIAHEIKNPLNFVNNFAEISLELVDELKEKLEANKILLKKETIEEISDIIANLEEIVTKINTHGNRADGIVKSMLLHSRASSGERSLVDINELLDQYLNLVYHGFRAKDKSFNVTIEKEYDQTLEKINIIPQDISRVFLNLLNNACYATNERKQKENETFQPRLKVETINQDGKVEIRIRDNGTGIPEKIKKNLFNPFFTTKPAGEGTGLGLSLSYDIVVKEHGGKLEFYSEENNFTEFLIVLPKK
jgi:signal transduction histidine kinase